MNSRDNVKTSVKGDILTIEINLSHPGEPSGSGKSLVIGSTGGNKVIDAGKHGQVNLGVNCYRPKA